MLAEGVFQTVKGNPERTAAAVRTMSEGIVSTLPEITQIPAEGLEADTLAERSNINLASPEKDRRPGRN